MLHYAKVKDFTKVELKTLLDDKIDKLFYDSVDSDEVTRCRCIYFAVASKVLKQD